MSEFRWYMISVLPDWEDRVAQDIADNLRARGLSEKVKHILVPKEEVPPEDLAKPRRGKPKPRFRPIYRGYVVVLADLDSLVWYVIMNTRPGVIGLVGSARKAVPMTATDVIKILAAAGWDARRVGEALKDTEFLPCDYGAVASLLVQKFGVQAAGDALLAADLPLSEVAQLMSAYGGRWRPPAAPIPVEKGDRVEITTGPAVGQRAVVLSVQPAKRRARVRLVGEGFLIPELEVAVDTLRRIEPEE